MNEVPEVPRPPRELHLPSLMLSHYLYALTRRPISKSNLSYLESRLAGLKSLKEAVDPEKIPGAAEVLRQMAGLHPAGFERAGTNIQFALLPVLQAGAFLPPDVVVEDAPPAPGWLAGHRRALLVLGPGIGVGDELILTPLPRWLKQANPSLEVTALSGYRDIWDRVRDVDRALVYRDLREMLAALRGEEPHTGHDLVILADFEAPELYRGVASDGRVPRYLELCLGSRSAFMVDNRRRWLNRILHLTPYGENYYAGLHQVARRLGLRPRDRDRFDGVMRASGQKPADHLRVFLSPFTSKYEPSHGYWSTLLAELCGGQHPRPVRVLLDGGKNLSTERFAAALARSASARVGPGVEIQVAVPEGGQGLTLGGVFDHLATAHAVVCADSFASHAAPLFGCNALVVMRAGVDNWRAPYAGSFYFDGSVPAREVGGQMRKLLLALETPLTSAERQARFTQAELRIEQLAREAESLFDEQAPPTAARLRQVYGELADLSRAVAEAKGLPELAAPWARRLDGVEGPNGAPDDAAAVPEALLLHLRDQFERWRNTNELKFLRLRLGSGGPGHPHRGREGDGDARVQVSQAAPRGAG